MPKTNLRLTRMFCVNLSSIDSVVLLKFEKKRLFSCALTDKKNGQTERQTDKLKKSCPRHSRTNIDVVCKFQPNRLSSLESIPDKHTNTLHIQKRKFIRSIDFQHCNIELTDFTTSCHRILCHRGFMYLYPNP